MTAENCPTCNRHWASSSGGRLHSEELEINGVPMKVLVCIGETLRCSNGHEWVSPVSLEEAMAEKKARMQKKYTPTTAVAWLKKFSQRDLLMGEQNHARILLKVLGEKL